jgi:uncharacterized protein YbjT (DUF2867 family)
MRIFLTGGTGYVGRNILRELVASGHSVTALVRHGSEAKLPAEVVDYQDVGHLKGVLHLVRGSLESPGSYRKALAHCDAVINLPGLLREFPSRGITFEAVHFLGTKNLVDEAKHAGVRRFLQMSALGVRAGAKTKYLLTKFRAEEYLKTSGLQWTIFRPSVIFGKEDEGYINFFLVLRNLLTMFPFVVPVAGNGNYKFQPVAVENVAAGCVKVLAIQSSIGKTYDVAGPEQFTYNQLLDLTMSVSEKKKIKFHQPMFLMKFLSTLLGRFSFFPVSRGQLTMLEEGNISDHWQIFFNELNIAPIYLNPQTLNFKQN